MRDRVHFYSANDFSVGMYVDRLECVLDSYEQGKTYENLTDIVELWECKQFIENVRFTRWDDTKYATYQAKIKTIVSDIIKHFQHQDKTEFVSEFEKLEYDYKNKVFEIFDTIVKDFLTDEHLQHILSGQNYLVSTVLHCENIVKKHAAFLTDYLKQYPKTAELLLSQYAEKRVLGDKKDLHFPSQFSLQDREKCIADYCDCKEANLNYVRLAMTLKDSNGLRLSPKTRLKAKNVAKRLNDELMTDARTSIISTKIGCSIEGKYTYDKPVVIEHGQDEDSSFKLITHVSREYLCACDNASLIYNFQLFFDWFNDQGYSLLVSNPNNRTFMEIFGLHAIDAYPTDTTFQHFNQLALLQLTAMNSVLEEVKGNKTLWESVIKDFYENHLKECYSYPAPAITIPSGTDDMVAKLRTLLPEMDAVVKQYDTYAENGAIDLDLISMGKPLAVTEARSCLKLRNVYASSDRSCMIHSILRLLFSDQSSIAFVQQFEGKNYRTFFDTVRKEEVKYDLLFEHQQRYVDQLIEQLVLELDENRIIRIVNLPQIAVYFRLWKYHVISYWQCSWLERLEIDQLIEKGWMETDNYLLSRQERDWLSYYLNNEKFTNGPAIRNVFLHGANTQYSEDRMKFFYNIVLMLFITLIYKIDLDLRLSIAVDVYSK